MSIKSDIRAALITICGGGNTTDVFAATVNSVDLNTRSCSVTKISGEMECDMPDVALMADVDNGQLIVPKVGSVVMVSNSIHIQRPLVVMFSEIDSALWVVSNSKFKISPSLMQFNDGSNGGLVNVVDLTTKLNNLENDINDLKKDISHILTTATTLLTAITGGGALTPIIGSVLSPFITDFINYLSPYSLHTLTPTVRANIEDTKVTH